MSCAKCEITLSEVVASDVNSNGVSCRFLAKCLRTCCVSCDMK